MTHLAVSLELATRASGKEILYKDVTIFSSDGHFVLTVEPNGLCNFGRGHYKKHSMKLF